MGLKVESACDIITNANSAKPGISLVDVEARLTALENHPSNQPPPAFTPEEKVCQCSTGGCDCTTTFTGLPAGASCTFEIEAMMTDFDGNTEVLEWVKADGQVVNTNGAISSDWSSGGCYSTSHSSSVIWGGTQGTHTFEDCPLDPITVPQNGEVVFTAKVSPNVGCCTYGGLVLNANIKSISCS